MTLMMRSIFFTRGLPALLLHGHHPLLSRGRVRIGGPRWKRCHVWRIWQRHCARIVSNCCHRCLELSRISGLLLRKTQRWIQINATQIDIRPVQGVGIAPSRSQAVRRGSSSIVCLTSTVLVEILVILVWTLLCQVERLTINAGTFISLAINATTKWYEIHSAWTPLTNDLDL
ncbi:hypothetical protein T11_12986 [Trichinella zimbabwensis]|uniref:Uncharacterized protein n=1 Tax=Trichinella zimbabwensis TaxID=268475 RepID=A0A0V1GZW2_9BILA|nr:hypothetical protein T11_12986 [Trichinella zimbabwensis]